MQQLKQVYEVFGAIETKKLFIKQILLCISVQKPTHKSNFPGNHLSGTRNA